MTWSNPVSLGAVNTAGAAHTTLTKAVTTTAGDSIFIIVYGYNLTGATISASDTSSPANSYSLDAQVLSGTASLALLSAHNTNPAGTITVSVSGAASTAEWGVLALHAAPGATLAGALDVDAVGTVGSSATPSSGATGTVSGGSELALSLAMWRYNNTTTPTITGANSYTHLADDGFLGTLKSDNGSVGYQNSAAASGTFTGNGLTANLAPSSSVAVCGVYKLVSAPVTPDPFPAGYNVPPRIVSIL